MTFEERPEKSKAVSNPVGHLRDKGFWQKKRKCKDPEAKVCLVCWKKQQDQGGQSSEWRAEWRKWAQVIGGQGDVPVTSVLIVDCELFNWKWNNPGNKHGFIYLSVTCMLQTQRLLV